jgi:hypothetical protein
MRTQVTTQLPHAMCACKDQSNLLTTPVSLANPPAPWLLTASLLPELRGKICPVRNHVVSTAPAPSLIIDENDDGVQQQQQQQYASNGSAFGLSSGFRCVCQECNALCTRVCGCECVCMCVCVHGNTPSLTSSHARYWMQRKDNRIVCGGFRDLAADKEVLSVNSHLPMASIDTTLQHVSIL